MKMKKRRRKEREERACKKTGRIKNFKKADPLLNVHMKLTGIGLD